MMANVLTLTPGQPSILHRSGAFCNGQCALDVGNTRAMRQILDPVGSPAMSTEDRVPRLPRRAVSAVLRWLRFRPSAVGLTATAAAPALAVAIALTGNLPAKLGLVAAACVAAAVGFTAPYARIRGAEQERDDARALMQFTVNAGLTPLVTTLNRVIDGDTAQRRRGEAEGLKVALAVAKDVIGPGSVRACWYELTEDQSQLVPRDHAGRPRRPRRSFLAGTPRGDQALKLVLDDDVRFVDDVHEDATFLVDPDHPGEYRTYIACSVSSATVPFGMLTLDSSEAGDLTEADADTLHLVGALLGAILRAARPRRRN